jgi:mannose/fructose/N-acetylgalactosamine-specific phosphotransferase system component IIC
VAGAIFGVLWGLVDGDGIRAGIFFGATMLAFWLALWRFANPS